LDKGEQVLIYVGGLPVIREWPSDYKAVFSPMDVIEEYIRPARYIENGVQMVRPAMSDPEYVFFPEVGTLEAFNTDGLRTLTTTLDARNMKEKTLRYPGHREKMAVLRALGFFSKEAKLAFNGTRISPLELTAQVLFPHWKPEEGEHDITIMQCIVEGMQAGRKMRTTIDLVDRYSPVTGVLSMARTTGYTATLAARMIADGLYTRRGISPPEFLGKHPACVDYLLSGLAERGVVYRESVCELTEG
jgi:saccharopine dehydrogenase-like NADP-dependent oxidoreductase